MMYLVFLLATLAYGIRTKLHAALQVTPDAACQQWLNSSAGQEFLYCESINNGVPIPLLNLTTFTYLNTTTNTTTNYTTGGCQLTYNDFSEYCTNPCYQTVTTSYNYFLSSGVCLAVYEDKYKPCSNNSDCAPVGNITRTCYQGFCYTSCNSDSDCNSCLNETCRTLSSSGKGCWNPTRVYQNGSALANRTIQNAFRGVVYSLEASCSRNAQGNYCGLLDWTNLTGQTCDYLNTQWGCCASTIMGSEEWCQWTNFTNANTSNLYNCQFTQPPCGNLSYAQSFCTFNVTNNNTNIYSSSSSSSSSSRSSSSSSSSTKGGAGAGGSSSKLTGGSSWLVTGVGGNGNGASSQATMSWAMTLMLVVAVAHIVS